MEIRTEGDQARVLWRCVERAAEDASTAATLRAWVAGVLREYSIPARDPTALASGLLRWCQTNIRYLREHPETLVAPAVTLRWRVADCDDFTILLCAALRGVKIPARAVLCGWTDRPAPAPIPLGHVWPEAWLNDKWTALEACRVGAPLGWNAADFKRAQGLRVRTLHVGDKEPADAPSALRDRPLRRPE